jgi:hypothetical protein
VRVFLSWSNPRSQAIAESLKGWLPQVIQAVEPWFSSQDIDAGSRWSNEVQQQLDECKAGILCMVPDNTTSAWIHFEAGALSKTVQKTMVIPDLDGLKPNDLKPPLSQFNACETDREGTLRMLQTLNTGLAPKSLPDEILRKAFDKFWPDLEERLKGAPTAGVGRPRDQREILEELLTTSRNSVNAISELRQAVVLNSFSLPIMPGTFVAAGTQSLGEMMKRKSETRLMPPEMRRRLRKKRKPLTAEERGEGGPGSE